MVLPKEELYQSLKNTMYLILYPYRQTKAYACQCIITIFAAFQAYVCCKFRIQRM